jgi:hypothetical protein
MGDSGLRLIMGVRKAQASLYDKGLPVASSGGIEGRGYSVGVVDGSGLVSGSVFFVIKASNPPYSSGLNGFDEEGFDVFDKDGIVVGGSVAFFERRSSLYFSASRSMRLVTWEERKYRSGMSSRGTRMSDNKDSSPGLRDSVIVAVKYLPFDPIPQFFQRLEDNLERIAFIVVEEPRDVFKQ